MKAKLFDLINRADTVLVDDYVIDTVGYSDNFMPGPPRMLARLTFDDTDYHFEDQEVEVVNGYAQAMALTWDDEGEELATEEVKVSMAFRVEVMLAAPAETFSASLFDALHASTLALVYDEAYELIGEAQSFFAVGDHVRIEIGTEEINLSDQKVAIDRDGACGVITTTGRALIIELAMSRPFTSADLEAYKCKLAQPPQNTR